MNIRSINAVGCIEFAAPVESQYTMMSVNPELGLPACKHANVRVPRVYRAAGLQKTSRTAGLSVAT